MHRFDEFQNIDLIFHVRGIFNDEMWHVCLLCYELNRAELFSGNQDPVIIGVKPVPGAEGNPAK